MPEQTCDEGVNRAAKAGAHGRYCYAVCCRLCLALLACVPLASSLLASHFLEQRKVQALYEVRVL